MRRIIKAIENHPYICLNILLIITGLVLYYPFIFKQFIFAYADMGYDTKHAFLPFYEYYVRKLADNRLFDYDFSYGLGTNVFANIYNFADPFGILRTLLGVLLGADKIGYMLIYIHFMKNIVLGNLGMKYLKMFDLTNFSCIVSSYVLAFCGYMMITGQHYSFSSYAVIFMLVIVMCEKTLRNISAWPGFVLSIAIQGVIGPYVLFQTLIAVGIYCIFRIFQGSKTLKMKDLLKRLCALVGMMLLGMLLSMIVFLPQCYEILVVSKRVSGGKSLFDLVKESFSLVSNANIQAGFFRLFSNHLQGLINSWEGPNAFFSMTPFFFSIFFPLCITQEVLRLFDGTLDKRNRNIRLSIFLLILFMFFSSFFPSLSNMFAYADYRFTYVLLPLFSICFAETLEGLVFQKRFSSIVCLITTVASIFSLFLIYNSDNIFSHISLMMTVFLLVLISILSIVINRTKKGKIRNVLLITLLGAISFSECFDAGIELYIDRSIVLKSYYNTNYHMNYLQDFEKYIENEEKENFVRVDRTFLGYDGSPDILFSFICPIRTVSVYNSTLNRYTIEFVQKIMKRNAVTQIGYSLNSYGIWYDSVIADLLGLKYIISQNRGEYNGWEMVSEYEGYYLYRNEKLDSAGLLFDNYISISDFEQLDEANRAIVPAQAVILEKSVSDIHEKKKYNYEVIEKDLEITSAVLEGSKESSATKELQIKTSDAGESGFLSMEYSGSGTYLLQSKEREVLLSGELLSDANKSIVIPITDDVKYVLFDPDENSKLEIEKIALCSYEKEYSNEAHFDNYKMGNVVNGNVVIDKSKILFMPIPYDRNWKAYVNEEEVEVLRADYGFIAVPLKAGENKVRFVYYNYPLYIGMGFSLFGVAIFLSIFYIQKKKARRK